MGRPGWSLAGAAVGLVAVRLLLPPAVLVGKMNLFWAGITSDLIGLVGGPALFFVGIVVVSFIRAARRLSSLVIGEPHRSGDCWVVPVTSHRWRPVDVAVDLDVTGVGLVWPCGGSRAAWQHSGSSKTQLRRGECQSFLIARVEETGAVIRRYIPHLKWGSDEAPGEYRCPDWDGTLRWPDSALQPMGAAITIVAAAQVSPPLRGDPTIGAFDLRGASVTSGYVPPWRRGCRGAD
jgi:hypothetical protein